MEKQQKFHHSITENGNLQLRIVTEYVKDGEVIDKKYSDPVTPADLQDMTGWDGKSKDIAVVITDKKVKDDFNVEKQEPTGVGLEEIVTYDRVIDELGQIAIRRITRIFNEGEEVNKKFHRSWIMPGDDVSEADVISKALAEKLHTTKVVDDYKEKLKKREELL